MKNHRFDWPIIGHKNIVEYLQHSVQANKVAHAYLFFGPDGIGKTALAGSFINSLVCENNINEAGRVPCGECGCCVQAAKKIHPDIIWLEKGIDPDTGKEKKNISIEQIRELQNRLHLRSFLNSYKVAVISQAESLSQEAANSLLKILEEPAENTVIILLTNNISIIPKTVISRCQLLKFLPVSDNAIFEYLVNDRQIEKSQAKILAACAYGRPGKAVAYLSDQDALDEYETDIDYFLSLHGRSLAGRFKVIQEIAGFLPSSSILKILNNWLMAVRDLILIKNSVPKMIGNLKFEKKLVGLSDFYDNKKLVQIFREINSAGGYLAANINPKLVLENLALKFPTI